MAHLSRPRAEFEETPESPSDDVANALSNEYVIDFARLRILRRIGERVASVELLAAFLDGQPVW